MITASYKPLTKAHKWKVSDLIVSMLVIEHANWTRVLCGSPDCEEELAYVSHIPRQYYERLRIGSERPLASGAGWGRYERPDWMLALPAGYLESAPNHWCLGKRAARTPDHEPAHVRRSPLPTGVAHGTFGSHSAEDYLFVAATHPLVPWWDRNNRRATRGASSLQVLLGRSSQAFATTGLVVNCPHKGHGPNILRAPDLEAQVAAYLAKARAKSAARAERRVG